MSALIEGFKKEHSEIIATLNEVEELGILSEEGQARIASVEASLLEHLKKEDVKFYPVLYKVAKHNNNLKNILDLFAMDMENVSKVVLEFFDKYSEEVIDSAVTGVFENLSVTLRNRIRNEEDILYDEYEIMNQ